MNYKIDNSRKSSHTQPVKWILIDVPRSALDQDLTHSLGALMTVRQIQRSEAEERIRALAEGKPLLPQLL